MARSRWASMSIIALIQKYNEDHDSSKLLQLRPVNYFYKPEYDDGSHLLQYGLIAEDVAKVYPEMVAYGKDGQGLSDRFTLQKLLGELANEPPAARLVLNGQCLRAFRKAVYGIENIGHYALAFRSYAHFTSPIRRYPDLIVHRIAKAVLASGASGMGVLAKRSGKALRHPGRVVPRKPANIALNRFRFGA